MISQTAEYALRAIIYLAGQGGEPCTSQVIAAETKVPQGYLQKIMQNLARSGVVGSKRGIRGGFTLSTSPAKLSVCEVIEAVDPIRRYKSCPLDLPWHCKKMCNLHSTLDDMIGEFVNEAQRTRIADLLPPADPVRVKRRGA